MRIRRALSIKQPYAERIMRGRKTEEYRTIKTNIRERVYVYASKAPGPKSVWQKYGYKRGSLPVGVLVGSVEITDCKKRSIGYAWTLARPRRAVRLIKPRNRPQPVWFHPF